MSSDNFFRKTPERDVLQMNMENISKELSDLMVTCEKEKEFFMLQQMNHGTFNSVGTVDITNRMTAHVDETQNGSKMFYQKMERVLTPANQCKPVVKYNLNVAHNYNLQYSSNFIPNNVQPYPLLYPPAACCVVENNREHLTVAPNGYACLPKYEFHYLRPQTETVKLKSPPLISLTAKDEGVGRPVTGSFRKYNRSHTKYNFRTQNESNDNKNIVVDISMLGISKDGKESNPVLRLFALFRGLHSAIAEVTLTLEPPSESAYEATFAPLPTAIMPCTMNVQHQVKYAAGQVVAFLCSMQRIVSHNVGYDQNLLEECERYLFKLRQLLAQFEIYKFIDLEHKRGQFVNEEVRVHAEHLEKLMEQINRQIREVNIRVIVFDWFIGMKYRGETGLKKSQSLRNKDNTPREKSEIGVVNEILQLCNSTPPISTVATITHPVQAASLELMNSVDNSKQLMNVINNKINDEFVTDANAASLPLPLAKMTAVNTHIRQPVFYIG